MVINFAPETQISAAESMLIMQILLAFLGAELIYIVKSKYERVKEKREAALPRVQETASRFNDTVPKHPWCYIISAALGGFLMGIIFRRKKCHK